MSLLVKYSSPAGTILLRQGLERLAWLQGDGTAYIDTGTKLNYSSVNNIHVICTNDFADKQAAPFIGTSSYHTGFMALYHYTNNAIYDRYITGSSYTSYSIPVGNKINFQLLLDYKNLKCSYWLNGSKDLNRTITKGSDTDNIRFFKGSTNNYAATKCKCYEVSISIDGGDLKHFIPVRVKSATTIAGTSYSTGTLGMYDYNNDKLYTNAASSGSFIAGPEAAIGLPGQYCLVEWLGFDKGKNVNTGVNMAAKQLLVMKMGIRYGTVGIGTRDLWGYSGTAGGYMGVTTGNAWEIHGSLSKTSDDIYRYNDITWTNTDAYTGDIWLGSLGSSGYSTRDKYISYIDITVAGVHKIHWVACYRRSDMMPGFYDLVSRSFKEMPGFQLGPSITFGWGEVVNGSGWNNSYNPIKPGALKFSGCSSSSYDRDTDTYTFTLESGHSTYAGMNLMVDNVARLLRYDWNLSYRFSFDIRVNQSLSVHIDYNTGVTNDNGLSVTTFNGNDNYGSALTASSSLTANTWKHVCFGATNNNSKNTNHVPLYDYSSICFPAVSSLLKVEIKNPKWELGEMDTSQHTSLHAIPHNIASGEGRFGKNTAFNFVRADKPDIQIPEFTMNLQNFTVAGWIKFTSAANYERLCDFLSTISSDGTTSGQGDGFLITRRGTSNDIGFNTYSNGASNSIVVAGAAAVNTWVHLAMTVKDGTKVTAYVNGVLAGTANRSAMPTNANLKYNWLGKSNWTSDLHLTGLIQDFLLFDHCIEAVDIPSLM